MAAKAVVFVAGCSGIIGSAAVRALSEKFSSQVEIRAGSRNPAGEKPAALGALPGVTAVRAVMGDKDQLAVALKGVDALCIVTPTTLERVSIVVRTAEVAKSSGVKHVVLVSGAQIGSDTLNAKEFKQMEDEIVEMGLPYTFIRLPFFMSNYFSHRETIMNQDTIFSPVYPDKPHAPIVPSDAGKALATALVYPEKHTNKVYTIHSSRHTYGDFACELSTVLGREIKVVRTPYEESRKLYISFGIAEPLVDGLIHAYQGIDEGSPLYNPPNISDLEEVIGEQPVDLKSWVASVGSAFQ